MSRYITGMIFFSCLLPVNTTPKKIDSKGTIIVINGTSSAGKTTVIQELAMMYPQAFVASIDTYSMTHQYSGFVWLRYLHFYAMIHKKAMAGIDVLVDTVLYHKRYAKYNRILEKHGINLIKVIAYCPLEQLIDHVEKRNKSGDALELRSINQAFRAFLELYTTDQHKGVKSIDQITSAQLDRIVQAAYQSIPHRSATSRQKLKVYCEKILALSKNNRTTCSTIYTKHPWDLIVNTGIQSPRTSAEQIACYVMNKRSQYV